MYLLNKLYQTYQNNLESIGKFEFREFRYGEKVNLRPVTPLLPIYHTTQHSHLTLTLDDKGNLIGAETNASGDTMTILPATEKSTGRTSGLSPHALCDKLQYVAGDYTNFVSDKSSGYKEYLDLLSAWADFDKENKFLQAILAYVKKGTLIQDLVTRFPKILPISDSGKILLKWEDPEQEAPPIYKLTAPATPADALVRWKVDLPVAKTGVWLQPDLYESWKNYQLSMESQKGLCYVTGEEISLATQHPSKIRNAGDGAKIISSNDKSGFTFRGRFCDATEVCGVGTEVTQKAHSALRWLISKQGWNDSTLSIVAWSPGDLAVPSPMVDSADFFDMGDVPEKKESTEEVIARALSAMASGYKKNLSQANEKKHVMILAMDSASPGRLAVSYFQEFPSNKYLENIQRWHTNCAWLQQFSLKKIFYGAPAPRDIVESAYGNNVDEKLRRQAIRRILPCIIENQPIPDDLVSNSIRRASNKIAMEWWEWEKTLGIACALYKYQQSNKTEYTMSLDINNTDRNYLFGRLLAVAERTENYALYLTKESRPTNAEKLMQRFSERPYSTWYIIEKALDPYYKILTRRKPGATHFSKNEIGAIMDKFETNDFTNDSKLSGAFLLGYHCQRMQLQRREKEEKIISDDDSTDSSTN